MYDFAAGVPDRPFQKGLMGMKTSKFLFILGCLCSAAFVTGGCVSNPEYQALRRSLPAGQDVIPSPALCRRALASDDARVVAYASRQCAAENQRRLTLGRENYEAVRRAYGTGR